jgi:hypothetical protein
MRERVLAGLLFVLAACGGPQREPARDAQRFDCRTRSASYVVSHHLAGDELGVQIDCGEVGPRIMRWRADKAGTREEDAHSLSPEEFNRIWREIDGTGWPNLRDCANSSGGKQDPVYQFAIRDDQNQASFRCQAPSMPSPYNKLVDPLDRDRKATRTP